MRGEELSTRLMSLIQFIEVQEKQGHLRPMSATDRVNYAKAESFMEGFIAAAEEDIMVSKDAIAKMRNSLRIVQERRELHERIGKKI